jgi:hypothetical protein
MTASPYPHLVFPSRSDKRHLDEMTSKGYTYVAVEVEQGAFYNLFFYDPVRLVQDLDENLKSGYPCIDEVGLVVVPEVILQAIDSSILYLLQQGFFDYLQRTDKPVTPYGSLIEF